MHRPPAPAVFLAAAAVLLAGGGSVIAQEPRTAPPERPVPKGVRAVRDIAYVAGGHERQKLDLYLPENPPATAMPLIIWVHGGGWAAGSRAGCPPLRQGFVEKGYAVASLGYRLSGDAVFPAQIEDCKAAVRWLRAHAAEYRLDAGKFGAWGSSAGGHLVSLLGTSGDIAGFDTATEAGVSSRVQAVCDFYGPTDFVRFVTTPGYESHAGPDSPESRLLGRPALDDKDRAARVNPVTFATKDDPPFLIVHGDKDPVVPYNQSEALFDALREKAVPVRFHTIRGAGHGSGFGGSHINEMVEAFFARHLAPGTEPAAEPVRLVRTESDAVNPPGRPDAPVSPAAAPEGRRRIPWAVITGRDDKDGDGKVSRTEFSGPLRLFERLDADGDGILTGEEHARLQQAAPPAPGAAEKPADAPH